ncbi:hypothetical protein [Clostridium felsineum]|uniref:hypothetical protein n=1 Tax=Clostridium felsineum TaxID=36839 RepID=UPI00098C519D|nr:hypothetical protein [Clostridium felsineum]URZ03929.1 hypothetical protein CLAUR_039950 [Clostridium felsineum]
MIRSHKIGAVFFYTICTLGVIFDILIIIEGIFSFEMFFSGLFFVAFGIPGYFEHKAYKRKVTKYNELLKENKLKRIEYSIDTIHTVKGRVYRVVFYINKEECEISFPQSKAKNNNNYEYYLEPIYKKNGEFKDFIAYADKKKSDEKCINSGVELREYEKKLSQARRQKNKDK